MIYSESPRINVRRPFYLDLCYPIPNLKPFIGRPEKKLHKHKIHKTFTGFNGSSKKKIKK